MFNCIVIYTLMLKTISFDRRINVWRNKKQNKTKKNKHNNEKNKTKRGSYHNSAKRPSTWVILENICLWPTPRKKERDLGGLQKKKKNILFGIWTNSKYPFGNKFIDCVLAKWTPPRCSVEQETKHANTEKEPYLF